MTDREQHVWGMALFHFMSATESVCELAKSPNFRDIAVDDIDKITEAALAVNLMWSQLKARKAA